MTLSAYMKKSPEERKRISDKNNARNKLRKLADDLDLVANEHGGFGDAPAKKTTTFTEIALTPSTTTELSQLQAEVKDLRDELQELKAFMREGAIAFIERAIQ